MQKFDHLHDKLVKCYAKIPYKQYFFSSEDIQEETCKRERDDLSDHLNSDDMNFENILKERVHLLNEIEKRTTSKDYKIPEKVDLSYFLC